jgi:predicted RNase H-like nuclease (RuvC/YqgF family)
MNYELLSKLALEEAEKSKNETLLLKKRNEILHHEVEKMETLIEKIIEEKNSLKNEIENLKNEIESLKSALDFKKDENQHFSHYS